MTNGIKGLTGCRLPRNASASTSAPATTYLLWVNRKCTLGSMERARLFRPQSSKTINAITSPIGLQVEGKLNFLSVVSKRQRPPIQTIRSWKTINRRCTLLMNHSIIFFDGFCNLCNSFINFIIDTDKKRIYRYSSLQSLEGQKLVKSIGQTPYNYKSLILVQNNMMYQKSTAVLKIFSELSFPWNLGYYFKIIPTFIRDYVYSIIASNRYNLFGKRNTCRVPNDEEKQLFLWPKLNRRRRVLPSVNITHKMPTRRINQHCSIKVLTDLVGRLALSSFFLRQFTSARNSPG